MTPLTTTTESQIELRPYQQDALTAIEAAARRGIRRQVISLPTGAGKTIIFCNLILAQQTRTLILVHRDELVRQTLEKLTMVARIRSLILVLSKPSAISTAPRSWWRRCRPCNATPDCSAWLSPSDWLSSMSATMPSPRTATVVSWHMSVLIRKMVP